MSLLINLVGKGPDRYKVAVNASLPSNATVCSSSLVPILPVHGRNSYTFHEWLSLYQPYADMMYLAFQNFLDNFNKYSDSLQVHLLNSQASKQSFYRYLYASSANASKDYVFLK